MGNDAGTFNVGLCYKLGTGVEKDEKKAFEYYKKSAEMGVADGMYYVGEFYRLGIVVEKNIDIAFEWYPLLNHILVIEQNMNFFNGYHMINLKILKR
ncbi:sel1 repeat domain-containing protein [Gigaspora margarita]|uniref:Sel1 repeat domain-containing protein n=1 Tax=Gigaspora margarita TaxID=4874 RepID=A0A8H3XF90_GIGMA|nr:sel1 repeat domain-containing protein [Gigaspora margarita]